MADPGLESGYGVIGKTTCRSGALSITGGHHYGAVSGEVVPLLNLIEGALKMKFGSNRFGIFEAFLVALGRQSAGSGRVKYPSSAALFLLLSAVAIAVYLVPSAAQAEGRCPPGMFETGSRDFLACAPIPGYGQSSDEGDYDSGPSSQGPSGPQYAESSMATAVHVDTSAVWGTAGHRSVEAAKSRVMGACAAAMGEGCIYSEAWTGDVVIAVAVDGGGEAWVEGADAREDAEKEALATCQKMAGTWGCKIVSSFRNVLIPAAADRNSDYSRDYFPQGPVKRRHWAFLAGPEGPPTVAWQRKTWLISGRQNRKAAEKEVLDRCQADTGASCTLGVGVPNGTMVHYVNKRGQAYWLNVAGVATPEARVAEFCAPDQMPCRILALYDAATPRLQVVSDPEPTRGYVSVAWPTKAGWPRLAIVTGRPTLAAANTDAIALCESQSKLTCELYFDSPELRGGMFMGFYSRSDGQLHIMFGGSVEDIERRAAEAATKNGVTFTNRAMVDLFERGEATPLYKD